MMVWRPETFLVPPTRAPPPEATYTIDEFATDVHFSHEGVPPLSLRARGTKLLGLLYERRVLDVLAAIYEEKFIRSPMIRYVRRGHSYRALPDGLLYLDDAVIIVEVKLAHTEAVWEQLMLRYRPLVRQLHPDLRVRTVEVCRSYDPAVDVPHSLITSLHADCSSGLEVIWWKI